ncbi:MAG: hypothetical protein ACKOXB_01970 [Flavobacteriales bacterium]
MEEKTPRDRIYTLIEEKAFLKQSVYRNTVQSFNILNEGVKELYHDLHKKFHQPDKGVFLEYRKHGEFEVRFKIAGDTIVFMMHTNIFDFEKSHSLYKTSYISDDPQRAYCGIINVYNFLSDSFKYNRVNDVGYLIARIFINKDNHFFVEGKRQLSYLYNDFANMEFNKETAIAVLESVILYCVGFDLLTPPFKDMTEVRVNEMEEASQNMKVSTGKRLGFKFSSEDDIT